MKLTKFPTPEEMLNNEKETLRLLIHSRQIKTYFTQLHADADNCFAKLNATKLGKNPMELLNFESFMDIIVGSKERRVYLGGLISLDNKNVYKDVSYSLTICNKTGPSKILRRFHFDFDCDGVKSGSSNKPFFHIQYAGKMSPRMEAEGFSNDRHYHHINKELSEPRIFFMPMSLLFLVYLILKEIDKEHADILEEPAWHKRMCENEQLILKPFYNTCNNALNQTDSILMDCYY